MTRLTKSQRAQQTQLNDRITHDLSSAYSLLNEISRVTHLGKVEILVLASYPVTLLFGQLIAWFSPREMAANYFTTKRNIFNTIFVKKGWLWTSILYILLIINACVDPAKQKNKRLLHKKILHSIGKYLIVTVCWYFYSQWFFGVPIMDKVFLLTGGSCYNIPESKPPTPDSPLNVMDFSVDGLPKGESMLWSNSISSKQCRRLRGSWFGGHDPSGHVYILTLSASFLLSQILYFYSYNQLVGRWKKMVRHVSSRWRRGDYLDILRHMVFANGYLFLLTLCVLWYWMLLMTSIYFHSMPEKLVGLLFSYATTLLSDLV